MNEYSRKRLDKAQRAIEAGYREVDAGNPDFAASHAYYAMFYAAEALLNERGLDFSSHGAVHGAFGKEFAKTKALDPKYHRWLLAAFKNRQLGTYGVDPEIQADEMEEMLERAKKFLTAAREYLNQA